MRMPYPKYKPSGVDWIGNVPEAWEVRRLKYLASVNGDSLTETTDPNYEMLYVDIGSVNPSQGIINKELFRFEDAPSRARKKVRHGDTIVSTVRTYLKAIAPIIYPEENLVVSTGFAVVRPSKVESSFLSYFLRSSYFVERVVSVSNGVSYPATNSPDILTIETLLPTPEEQASIATFLDHETFQIDNLIEKKKQFIEKLKEKRSALISQTVTKGLPPEEAKKAGLPVNSKLKPSGVDWLGDIPDTWEVRRLKYLASVNGDSLTEMTDPDYEMLYVDIGSVNPSQGIINKEVFRFEDAPSRARKKVRHGDTIVSTVRTYLKAIAPILYPEENLIVSTGFAVVRPSKVESSFLSYFLRSSYFVERVVSVSNGVSYPATNSPDVLTIETLLPSAEEQASIANFLDRETFKIDRLAEKVTTAIDKLQEYRLSLITAAVTGKIDVREQSNDL